MNWTPKVEAAGRRLEELEREIRLTKIDIREQRGFGRQMAREDLAALEEAHAEAVHEFDREYRAAYLPPDPFKVGDTVEIVSKGDHYDAHVGEVVEVNSRLGQVVIKLVVNQRTVQVVRGTYKVKAATGYVGLR